ncbi:MAG: 50S ribosomal protein L32 [Patescibacteria group bacterium]
MAPLPKRRHSTRRGGKRQAEWLKAFTIPGFTKCPQCGMLRVPHRVCKACGWYNRKAVVIKRA